MIWVAALLTLLIWALYVLLVMPRDALGRSARANAFGAAGAVVVGLIWSAVVTLEILARVAAS